MISLEKFIENTKGKQISTPWGTQKGQCVSLIQQYISQCLDQPAKARGHAKTWITNYVKEGLGTIVKSPIKGDILVFPKEANGYGHIAIYIDKNKLYDQNNGRHDNFKAGYGRIFTNDYVVLRPNTKLVEETKKEETIVVSTPKPTTKNHKVVKGDTISKICKKYYNSYTRVLGNKIVEANKSKYPKISLSFIRTGWVLTIPNK